MSGWWFGTCFIFPYIGYHQLDVLCMATVVPFLTGLQKLFAGTTLQERKEARVKPGSRMIQKSAKHDDFIGKNRDLMGSIADL